LDIWIYLGTRASSGKVGEHKKALRNIAVGYLEGNRIYVRPDENRVALMCLIDEELCWTHLTREEFEDVFPEHQLR